MKAHCARCGQPRHIVGGRAKTVRETRQLRRGDLIVETIHTKRVLMGSCEACGSALRRYLDPNAVAGRR